MTRQLSLARAAERAPGPGPRLPAVPDPRMIEPAVLRRWRERDVFERSLAQASGGPLWTCAGEPPAASGLPGIHHLPDLAVRDLYQRYRTMRGDYVPRPLAWNCHGLATEVAVERELGMCGPPDIERYGIDRFTARCRESAVRHEQAHAAVIERFGHWASLTGARRSMDPGCVESIWSCVHRLFSAGLLVRDERIAPYCPRCQTNLSDHELARPASSRTVTDNAVTVRFPITALPEGLSPWLGGADLLAVTAPPWTLAANAAIAVHPHQTYAVARRAGHGDRVVVADGAASRVLGEGWHVVARLSGDDLAGLRYQPPFGKAAGHRVITGYFVTAESGTGLAALAPDFGTDDLAACREHGLTPVSPIEPDGRFLAGLPLVGGVFFRAADPILIEALADRGLLFASERTERARPHCWRCGTILLSRVLTSWYVRTSAISEQLLAADRGTSWVPAPVRPGSDSGWLRRDADWAVSRTRYWGTPLPIWECEHGHLTCVPSLARLSDLAGRDVMAIDPHRPAIDEVTFPCPRCAATARRAPEVIDSAFDAAVISLTATDPAAGAHPAAGAGRRADLGPPSTRRTRADLATATADDGGGWLYALMTSGILLTGQPAFSTALCLGSVLDGDGTAMSGGLGNVVDPLPHIDKFGADALRWFFAASAPPSAPRRLTEAALCDVVRTVLGPYWDCVVFYAGQASSGPSAVSPPPGARPPLDRWLLSELQSLVADVTAAFDSIRSAAAGRRIAWFIDQLATWYLPRSRRRFSVVQAPADHAAAHATLRECLDVLTRLMAPVVPFLADYAWEVIRTADAPDSVHLAPWPVPAAEFDDPRLTGQMALARRVAELGRSALAAAAVKASQPLARAMVSADTFAELGDDLLELVAGEVNVGTIERLPDDGDATAGHALAGWAVAADDRTTIALDLRITPELHRAGLAAEVIALVIRARDDDGIGHDERIALRWSAADGEVARVLTDYGPMICAEVLAAEYGPLHPAEDAGPADMADPRHCPELGLTFRIWPMSA